MARVNLWLVASKRENTMSRTVSRFANSVFATPPDGVWPLSSILCMYTSRRSTCRETTGEEGGEEGGRRGKEVRVLYIKVTDTDSHIHVRLRDYLRPALSYCVFEVLAFCQREIVHLI